MVTAPAKATDGTKRNNATETTPNNLEKKLLIARKVTNVGFFQNFTFVTQSVGTGAHGHHTFLGTELNIVVNLHQITTLYKVADSGRYKHKFMDGTTSVSFGHRNEALREYSQKRVGQAHAGLGLDVGIKKLYHTTNGLDATRSVEGTKHEVPCFG